jgi:hypothetical protein
MRQGKAKYLFPGNNTPQGFISHYANGLRGLNNVFILKGGPGVGKSTLMRKIGIAMLERGYDVEFWQCSSDNDSIDGVIIPAISTGIIDGTAPHIVDPKYPGAVEEVIDLGLHWNRTMLKSDRKNIIEITDSIGEHFASCYQHLSEAGKIFQQVMDKSALKVDLKQLELSADELIADIFNLKAQPRHLFSTAVTPRGVVSFAEALSRSSAKRWLLIGPSGCGKEKLMQLLVDQAEQRGHFAEVYHPSIMPDNVELILLPYLDCAILDAGSELPSYANENDIVIDCAAFCSYEWDSEDEERINQLVESAVEQVAGAKEQHDKLESHYTRAMDFEGVDSAGAALFNRVLSPSAQTRSPAAYNSIV